MSIITVNGQQVDVGDDYDKMSPEEQKATQEDIANQLGLHEQAAQDRADTQQLNNAGPTGAMDMSNPNSTARQVVDPAIQYGGMAANGLNQFLSSPLGHLAEGAAGLTGVAKVAGKFGDKSGLSQKLDEGIKAFQDYASKQHEAQMDYNALQREKMAAQAARQASIPKPVAPPQAVPTSGPIAPQGPAMAGDIPNTNVRMPTNMPNVAQGAQMGQQAAPTAENFLSRMTQMAKQYAPAATEYAGSVGKVVAPIARFMGSAPVLGAQLMAHSGELNTNEDRLLAEKHALEQRMLQNKHDAEWSKYVDAKIKGLGQ
jgi:hypothetical protein